MNHISNNLALSDGRSCRVHSWELREGGYRRLALLLGNGLWAVEKDARMISFLLDKGFRVLALDMAFGTVSNAKAGLRAYREAVATFAQASVDPELPFYVVAQSFSAGAVIPIASDIPGLAAAALVAPVVEFPPPRMKRSCFLASCAELPLEPEDLCGDSALAAALVSEGLMPERAVLKFRKRDLWAAAADLSAAVADPPPIPVAIFAGEDDPFITPAGHEALARSEAKIYSYPRVRHDPSRDRYADNFYADLGAFLSEVESMSLMEKDD